MSNSNFIGDLDSVLALRDAEGFLEVPYPDYDLHIAILQKGYIVISELTEFTLYRLKTFIK